MTKPLKKILRVAAIGHEYKHAAGRKKRLTGTFIKKFQFQNLQGEKILKLTQFLRNEPRELVV